MSHILVKVSLHLGWFQATKLYLPLFYIHPIKYFSTLNIAFRKNLPQLDKDDKKFLISGMRFDKKYLCIQ